MWFSGLKYKSYTHEVLHSVSNPGVSLKPRQMWHKNQNIIFQFWFITFWTDEYSGLCVQSLAMPRTNPGLDTCNASALSPMWSLGPGLVTFALGCAKCHCPYCKWGVGRRLLELGLSRCLHQFCVGPEVCTNLLSFLPHSVMRQPGIKYPGFLGTSDSAESRTGVGWVSWGVHWHASISPASLAGYRTPAWCSLKSLLLLMNSFGSEPRSWILLP